MIREMNPSLRKDILDNLKTQYKGVIKGNYIGRIECPSCHKREAFASVDSPWMVKCGRENKCGAQHHVKDLFPELFETWTERFEPKTDAEKQANPTAVADAYLQEGRGFAPIHTRGMYTQEFFFDRKINEGTTTVRFQLPRAYWERLIDKPKRFGNRKANFIGEYKGDVWMPPTKQLTDYAEANEIWIVEGIFDAIALLHHGIMAVSNMACGNYPSNFLQEIQKVCAQGKRPRIIWAQDGNRAGRNATLKHCKRAVHDKWQCGAAQPPADKDQDWNDLHQVGRLKDHDIEKYLHYGDLLLAKSAGDKALLMYGFRPRREFWFTFDGQMYWWNLDMDSYDKQVREHGTDGAEHLSPEDREMALKSAGCVTCICTAIPRPLYFMQNLITDESWYYMAVERPDGPIEKKPFTPKQLTNPGEFKNRLLAIKNSWWMGTPKQLDRILQEMMHDIKTVETVDFIGYCKKHGAYIFNEVAVREGKIGKVNEEDFFQFGKLSVKSLSQSPELNINPDLGEYERKWPGHLWQAFNKAGVIGLAFWVGSLFAEQIRHMHQSYPFFELVGEAGAGKSTLLEFFWKLFGRADWEGQDPNKMTAAARGRYFAQVSNLPIVLLEADREDTAKAKQFDWDELKPAYNGRPMRSRGQKNSGNDTYEPPMRGTIVISQNAKVDASEAILSRILHVSVTREHHDFKSKNSSDFLARIPVEQVSGFVLETLKQEQQLLDLFNSQTAHYEDQLQKVPELRMVRIIKNHAQLLALIDCLGDNGLKLIPEEYLQQCRDFVLVMAQERQNAINSDHPMVVEFWEAYDYIQNLKGENRLNHAGVDSGEIAINLKQFESWCGELKLRCPPIRELKPFLASSKSRKFIKSNHAQRSVIQQDKDGNAKTVKCWIFKGAN